MEEGTQRKGRVVNERKVGCLVLIVAAIIAILLWVRSKRNSDTNVQEHPAVKIKTNKAGSSSTHELFPFPKV